MSGGRKQGFSLLEVMVAVTILAISLSSIYAAQVGTVRSAQRANSYELGTLLARCKMNELEENVLREGGLPAIDDRGSDECCEDAEIEGFRCEWEIQSVLLPGPPVPDGDGLLDDAAEGGGDLDTASLLAGGSTGDIVADIAVPLAYPALQAALEAQVRFARVKVLWEEGERERSLEVSQYLVGAGATPVQAADPQETP